MPGLTGHAPSHAPGRYSRNNRHSGPPHPGANNALAAICVPVIKTEQEQFEMSPLRDDCFNNIDLQAALTPHIGWKRLETRQRLVDAVADNVAAYLAGAPTNVVSQPRVRKAGLELEEVQGLRVRLNEPRIREERGCLK